MLTVTVAINDRVVEVLHARRTNYLKRDVIPPDLRCDYEVTDKDGKFITNIREHRYGDGAARLAAKLLKNFGSPAR